MPSGCCLTASHYRDEFSRVLPETLERCVVRECVPAAVIDLAAKILGILAPGFLLACIGLVWQRRGLDYPLDFVTRLVLDVSMPALLFHTLLQTEAPVESLVHVALATALVHILFAAAATGLLKFSRQDWRLSVAHVVGNTGNLGIPVCFFAFGDTGLAYAITFFALQCLLLFTCGEAIVAGRFEVRRAFTSPIVIAIVLAILFKLSGIAVPELALNTLGLLGQITIPLMLITLGVSLASMRAGDLGNTLLWSVIRTGVAVLIGFGVAALLGLEGAARGVVILQTIAPVAVFNFLLAVRHQRDSEQVAGLVLVTHIGAIIYLPLVLAVLLAD